MKVYLTVIVSFAIVRFIMGEAKKSKNTGPSIIATLLCIATEVLGIVFIWKI
jgi:hypothetical protein